ncbi:hypothetical protein Patl1_05552 [Pistacia atlantica]|uniref:Uncharacterized protein n=1 Tax=Pistacia atlantica TaxID=434234 RepID=A0ACC1BS60_9ROSI|nr:hypothetical protein Patl1_05552 [Pistacia atlantica]
MAAMTMVSIVYHDWCRVPEYLKNKSREYVKIIFLEKELYFVGSTWELALGPHLSSLNCLEI